MVRRAAVVRVVMVVAVSIALMACSSSSVASRTASADSDSTAESVARCACASSGYSVRQLLSSIRVRKACTMPLHERDEVRDRMSEPVFARGDIARALPKYRFPPLETDPAAAYQVVADELLLDGNSRQN